MQLIDIEGIEPGCYVDSHWGWRGLVHLLDQFAELDAAEADVRQRYLDGDGDLAETMTDMADELERMLNDALPTNLIAHWHDGEFFVSPHCGADPYVGEGCSDDTCFCQVY